MPTVLMENGALDDFLAVAGQEYERLTAQSPYPCFALLLGVTEDDVHRVKRVAFGRNARTSDPAARGVFADTVVPRFGPAYENQDRGWWIDSRDLLQASREADAEGLDILGSIHMHPDWHHIGPPTERGVTLSENPTPMDCYVFGCTAWPANLICYLERSGTELYHAVAAWAADGTRLPLRIRTPAVAGA